MSLLKSINVSRITSSFPCRSGGCGGAEQHGDCALLLDTTSLLAALSLSSLFLVSGLILFLLLCKICIYGICDYAVWKYSCVSLELESGLDWIGY